MFFQIKYDAAQLMYILQHFHTFLYIFTVTSEYQKVLDKCNFFFQRQNLLSKQDLFYESFSYQSVNYLVSKLYEQCLNSLIFCS